MFALKRVRTVAQIAARERSTGSSIVGPPSVRLSFGAKVVHGIIMTLAMGTFPIWFILNIKKFQPAKG